MSMGHREAMGRVGSHHFLHYYHKNSILSSLNLGPSQFLEAPASISPPLANRSISSAPTETGMSRLALTPSDAQARKWFIQTTQSLNCTTHTDAMGNIFAIRPGRLEGAPTYAGSHLDTQPTGGRYDGILGVCAGIEMLRVLEERGIETEGPIGVVNWTNEEGARFPISRQSYPKPSSWEGRLILPHPGMVSSGVWAGSIPLSRAHDLKEVTPTPHGGTPQTMKEALQAIDQLGPVECSYQSSPMAAHFELHIEQGPHLTTSIPKQRIGIVTGVQSYRWYTLTVTGRDAHTGTTAFEHRADALLAAARMMVKARETAREVGCLASVGVVEVRPGSVNTVPGLVRFSLDVRAVEDSIVHSCEEILKREFDKLAVGGGDSIGRPCKVEWKLDLDSPATKFHPDCISCVESAAVAVLTDFEGGKEGKLTRKMTSGAGHDSVFASQRCPTSMIFVPCRDGVSHHPEEYCAPEDCAVGASVLMGAVVRFDVRRSGKGEL